MVIKSFIIGMNALLVVGTSQAAVSVNVDVEGSGHSTYSGQGAYSDSGNDYWNSAANGLTDLTASDGTATSVDVAISSGGRFEYTLSHDLMADYAYAHNTDISVDITGLSPEAAYDLYVYCQGDQLSQAATVTSGSSSVSTSGDTSGSLVEGGNYVVLSEIADADGMISVTVARNGNSYVALNGLQIVGDEFPAPKTYLHPGIGMTVADLNHIKANLNVEPWKTGYEALSSSSTASLSYTMQGPFASVGHTAAENRNAWRSDMIAVHDLARMWYFTENEAYAQKARDILISWATTQTEFLSGETYLDMGYHAHDVFGGASILRGTWPGWTQADTDICKTYFESVWWDQEHIAVPNPLRSANQGMSQFAAALGTAVFLDDEDKFEQCLEVFRSDAAGGLLSSLPNGQIGDTGRDSHDQGQLMLAAWAAEVFWNQGVDVYSEYDNRLLAAGEYIARFNLLAETPFIQAGTVYDVYPRIHTFVGDYPNCSFETKLINLLYNAYVVRKGMSAPYLEKYLSYAPQSKNTFCHLMSADTSSATPREPLDGPADFASVTTLNQVNMGDCAGGSASYNAGTKTWTVTGRGSDLWYSSIPDYRFAYLPVTGDATIIAQITSLNGSEDGARAGLVFSEDLTDSAAMQSIFIINPNGNNAMNSIRRGDVAHSHQGNAGSREYPRMSDPKIPYWLKIERIGNRFNCYSSPDGASWSCGESANYDVGETAYFGLAVCSHDNSSLATATFTDVRITGGDAGEAIEIPEAPFAIYASPGGDQVPMRWLESFEADSYKIWRSTQSGGPYTLVAEETGTSFVDTNIVFGTHYYYAVSAVNAMGESPLSPEDQFYFPNTDYYEAEEYDDHNGVGTENCNDFYGGINLSDISSGNWARYDDIPLGAGAVFQARMAVYGEDHGRVEVRLDSSDGTLIGTLDPGYTGSTQGYGTFETNLVDTVGTYDLYLVFTAGESNGPSFNLNWFDIVYPDVTEYDLGMDMTLTFDPELHDLTNLGDITAWDSSLTHLKLTDGSDLGNLDFSELGIDSWKTTNFSNAAQTTIWAGANLNGVTLIADGNFGAGDNLAGADFSNMIWGEATTTADAAKFFSGGSGATSALDKDQSILFYGADLSLISGEARTIMINNLGGFDGDTAIGARFDPLFVLNSGWDTATLIAAGWQYWDTTVDAFSVIEAEDYDDNSGITTEACDEGGLNVAGIHAGEWCAYYDVNFGLGASEFQARVASRTSGGTIEIRLDSPTGTLLGACAVSGTGNWQNWTTVSTTVNGASGVHDLYLVFTEGEGSYLFNVNWFSFTALELDTTPPAAPTGLTATAGERFVSLDWADNSDVDLAGYTVYRSVTGGSGYAAIVSNLSSSVYVDASAVHGTTYYFVVTATDTSMNESVYSIEASAEPVGPEPPDFLPDITISNGTFSVQFTGLLGQHYRFEYNEDLAQTNGWQTVTDIVSLATSPYGVSAPATNNVGFYRILSIQ